MGLHGIGLHVLMSEICRADRQDHRHEKVWRLGTPQRAPEEIQIYDGGHREKAGSEESDGGVTRGAET